MGKVYLILDAISLDMSSPNVKLLVLFVTLIVVFTGFVHVSSELGSGEEEDDVVEAPEWKKGYEWEYEAQAGEDAEDWETITSRVVETEQGMEPGHPEDDVEYEETYRVEREAENTVVQFRDKTSLSLIFTDPDGSRAEFYHPPRVEYNFPFQVGDTWNETSSEFHESATGDFHGPEKGMYYNGTVEEKMRFDEIEDDAPIIAEETYIGSPDDRIEDDSPIYKLNVSMIGTGGEDEDEQISMGRVEYYYSPEIKNVVATVMHESRLDPVGRELEEKHSGNEVLKDFSLEEDEEVEAIPFLSISLFSIVLLTSASIYFIKKKHSKE